MEKILNWKEILKSEILPESKKELFGHLVIVLSTKSLVKFFGI